MVMEILVFALLLSSTVTAASSMQSRTWYHKRCPQLSTLHSNGICVCNAGTTYFLIDGRVECEKCLECANSCKGSRFFCNNRIPYTSKNGFECTFPNAEYYIRHSTFRKCSFPCNRKKNKREIQECHCQWNRVCGCIDGFYRNIGTEDCSNKCSKCLTKDHPLAPYGDCDSMPPGYRCIELDLPESLTTLTPLQPPSSSFGKPTKIESPSETRTVTVTSTAGLMITTRTIPHTSSVLTQTTKNPKRTRIPHSQTNVVIRSYSKPQSTPSPLPARVSDSVPLPPSIMVPTSVKPSEFIPNDVPKRENEESKGSTTLDVGVATLVIVVVLVVILSVVIVCRRTRSRTILAGCRGMQGRTLLSGCRGMQGRTLLSDQDSIDEFLDRLPVQSTRIDYWPVDWKCGFQDIFYIRNSPGNIDLKLFDKFTEVFFKEMSATKLERKKLALKGNPEYLLQHMITFKPSATEKDVITTLLGCHKSKGREAAKKFRTCISGSS